MCCVYVCRWGRDVIQRKVGNIYQGMQDERPGGHQVFKQNQGRCGVS